MPVNLATAIRWNGTNYNEINKVFKSLNLNDKDSRYGYKLSQEDDRLVITRVWLGWGKDRWDISQSIDIGGWFISEMGRTQSNIWQYILITDVKFKSIKRRQEAIKVLETLELSEPITQEQLDFINSDEQRLKRQEEENALKERLLFIPSNSY